MEPASIGDLFSQAMYLVLLSVVVLITPSLMIGLVISTFQAATQINEQTLSFLPRLVITLLALLFLGPWLVNQVIDYTQQLYMNIPFIVG